MDSQSVVAHVGGNFNNGANDGVSYWNFNNTSGNSNQNIGSRTFMKKYLHTIILATWQKLPKTYIVSSFMRKG